MDAAIWAVIPLFVIAWAVVPFLVISYRCTTVPRRHQDIRNALLGSCSGGRHPAAYHYARLVTPYDMGTYDAAKPDELAAALGELVDREFYGIHAWRHYALPLGLIMLVLAIELAICESWVETRLVAPVGSLSSAWPAGVLELHGRIPLEIIMALLGGYVWTLYEIVSRKAGGDLTPHELNDVLMRLLVAVPIGYAFSVLAISQLQAALAFTASAFPIRDVRRVLRERALRQARQGSDAPEAGARLTPMERVVGALGYETVARLQELQISTPTDIAFTDPVWLMVRIGFAVHHVLTWMDQSLLAIYAGAQRPQLARLGIPCALDACSFYVRHCWDLKERKDRDCADDPALAALACQLEMPPALVRDMLQEIYEDPHVRFVAEAWDPRGASELYPDDGAGVAEPKSSVAMAQPPAIHR